MSDDLLFFDAAAKGENAVASRELGKPLRVNPCSTQNEVYTDLPHKETPNGNFLVHLGSPWNAALTFKKKSGRLPPRKKSSAHSKFQADSSY